MLLSLVNTKDTGGPDRNFIMMEISVNKIVTNPTKWQRILGWMHQFQEFELPKLQLISIR